jgi:hypothetical protein
LKSLELTPIAAGDSQELCGRVRGQEPSGGERGGGGGKKKMEKGLPELQRRLLSDFSRNPVFLCEVEQTPVAAGGSLKNSEGKYLVKNRLVANVEAMVQYFGFAILLAHVFG